MRLLHLDDDGNLSLVERLGDNVPSYAILSHTWGADSDEVSFQDLMSGRGESKLGYRKVRFCADQAARDGLRYFWIDTCCIDKSSSAELSEAIISMFRWYQKAERCYVYLSDVLRGPPDRDEGDLQRWKSEFKGSRWFTRGWTLQELIAPASVEFFSREWIHLGSKSSMEQTIHERTGVAIDALRGASMSQFTMDERFMWAEGRTTKREEDAAYCLLGIFGIHMLPMYGEGQEEAKGRLEKEIKESLGNRVQSLSDEQKQTLLDSLRFEQIDARQMTIKNAHAKTCKWLLRKSEYRSWLNGAKMREHHGFLWIKGKPGTGKSTLMKFAFANARKTMKDRIVLSFFFNARGEDIEKSTIGTYRSLLLQLLERLPALRSVFDSLGFSTLSTTTNHVWSIESLKMLLEHAIQSLGDSPVVCFIDALDECEEAQIRDMILFFERVGELTSSFGILFQVCFSSRHYPHITIRKGLDLVLEGQEGHTQDITNYLEAELKIGKSKLAQQIRGEIQEKASGVFMWVVLVVEILNKEHDRGRMHALRKRLEEIPSELHELFRDILTRDSGNRDELILCIQWVLFARQPLSPEQLYFAILSGVEADAVTIWDPDEITRDVIKRFILDSSKGLTEITKSKLQKVQFIHESVRDFLLKEDGLSNIWPDLGGNLQGQSHQRLKQCCHNYLSVDVFTPLNIPDDLPKASSREAADFRKSASEAFPFLEYAAQNVLYHANAAEGSGITQAHFLENFELHRWIRIGNLLEKREVRRHSVDASLLYLLGEHNMPHLIGVHPSAASCLEVENERYGCPIFAAMATMSKEAVQMFQKSLVIDQSPTMESHEADGNSFDEEWSQTGPGRDFKFSRNRGLLSYSAEFGCSRAVSFLLKTGKFNVNSKDNYGRTAFWWAVQNSNKAVVKLLLKTGEVNVNLTDNDRQSALSWAAEKGREAVVKLLLEIDKVDLDSKVTGGQTALSRAAEYGREAVVRLLIETGRVDVNSRDPYGRTVLSWAIENNHAAVARLLLDTGKADADANALSWAIEKGLEAVVELLFEKDKVADVNGQGEKYDNILHFASQNGLEKTVQTLLDKGANVDSEGKDGNNLWVALKNGHQKVAQILLDRGANAITWSANSGNALYLASQKGYEKVVQLLLDRGTDVNQHKADGNALYTASQNGHEKVVQLLLDRGADVNAQGGEFGNALQTASQKGDQKMVQILLDRGADINAQGGYYGNALQAASTNGSEKVVQLLLDRGADVNAQGGSFGNALQAASWWSREKVVRILLDNGADINAWGGEYGSALQAASHDGNVSVVQMLLDKGAHVNTQGGEYGNALQAASYQGSEIIVQVLLEKGADVNAGGKYGNALNAARSRWKPDEKVVQILLQHMADNSAENAAKRSASQAEIGSGNEDVVAKKPKAADAGSPSTHAGAEEESANVGRGDENEDKT